MELVFLLLRNEIWYASCLQEALHALRPGASADFRCKDRVSVVGRQAQVVPWLRPPGFAVWADFFLFLFVLGEGFAWVTFDEDG